MKLVDDFADRVGDKLKPVIEDLGEKLIDKALAMIAAKLPELAAAVAKAAVEATFQHTQVDETINKLDNVFEDVLGQWIPGWGKQ